MIGPPAAAHNIVRARTRRRVPSTFRALLMSYARAVNPISPFTFVNPLSRKYPWLNALFIVPNGCSASFTLSSSFSGTRLVLSTSSSMTSWYSTHRYILLWPLFVHLALKGQVLQALVKYTLDAFPPVRVLTYLNV